MTPLPDSLLEAVAAAAVREGLADAVFTRLPTPIGRLLVVQGERGVVRVGFEEEPEDRVLADVAAEPGHAERLEEAAALARRACEGLPMQGRALAAGYASLPWPDDPLTALWHAAGILREHRGDGHIAALVTAPLDPVEAIITAGLDTGTPQFMRETRGWDDADWAAAGQRLAARGLLRGVEGSDVGELTDAGVELRRSLELQTDLAAAAAWTHLGLEDTQRLGELMRPLTKAVVTSGVLPAGLGAPRR